MTSSNRCRQCGEIVDVDGINAGQSVACKQCGRVISTPSKSWIFVWYLFAVGAVVLIGGGVLAWQEYENGNYYYRINRCKNTLKRLTVAIHNYTSVNKCFPPAFVVDKNGKRMHSWRALVLPYLDEELGAKYNFNEPWNSPGNREVTRIALPDFKCWKDCGTALPTTSYMMVVGPHTISDGRHSRKTEEITDGLSDTITLVEVANSGVRWAEPKDLEFEEIDFKINGKKRPGISSQHSCGANIAMCDGSVRWFSDTIMPVMLKAMLTIDGGEKIQEEELY
jgi:prepilin-type processing-associated H-X9-DG protein